MHISHACFKKEGQKKEKKETKSSRGGFSGQIHRTRIAIRRESWNKRNHSRLVGQIGERMENKYNHRCRWFAERERKREREGENSGITIDRSIEVCGRGEIDEDAPRSCETGRVIFQARSKLSTPQKSPGDGGEFREIRTPPSSKLERKMLEREFEPAVIVQQRRKTSA